MSGLSIDGMASASSAYQTRSYQINPGDPQFRDEVKQVTSQMRKD